MKSFVRSQPKVGKSLIGKAVGQKFGNMFFNNFDQLLGVFCLGNSLGQMRDACQACPRPLSELPVSRW